MLFAWLSRYLPDGIAAVCGLLLMISAPIRALGSHGTPDCVSVLITVMALSLLLETHFWALGFLLLLASVYVRTDNILLALPTIAYFWANDRIKAFHALTLSVVAIASVWLINHFAGDYGLKMLYYRGFIGAPVAPGEMNPQFSLRDYLHAFRSGVTELVSGFPVVFLLWGTISVIACRHRTMLVFAGLTAIAAGAHFLIFPLAEDRYFGPAYIGVGILGIASAAAQLRNTDLGLHICQTDGLAFKRSA
jgi:hypothetical protein